MLELSNIRNSKITSILFIVRDFDNFLKIIYWDVNFISTGVKNKTFNISIFTVNGNMAKHTNKNPLSSTTDIYLKELIYEG